MYRKTFAQVLTNVTPLSMGVSVRNGTVSSPTSVFPLSAGVSTTTGPYISSISPNSVTRGATVTITINGANLTGAINIKFIDINGALDSNTTASNPIANGDGTSLTATMTVSGNATLGQRVVIVSTANSHSLISNVGINAIEIIQ